MKFTEKDDVQLYVRSMGKLLRVTAAFESVAEANAYMKTHNEAVVAEKQGTILLAGVYDKGLRILEELR